MENPRVSVSSDTTLHHGYITINDITVIAILNILKILSMWEMRKFYLLKHKQKEGKN
jgi:hypothetical protein